jgi:branched-chain amino acid transport system permease protein
LRRNSLALLLLLAVASGPLWLPPYELAVLTRALMQALAAFGLAFMVNTAGMVSLGHAATLGFGAYAAGVALASGPANGWLVLGLGTLAAAAWGAVTGLVTARLRGLAFMLATLALGQVLVSVATGAWPLGGDDGLTLAGDLVFLPPTVPQPLFWTALGLLLLAGLLFHLLERAPLGLTLQGLRQDERRMASLGISALPARLLALALGSAAAGAAGVLQADQIDFVSPALMDWTRSGELLAIVLVGRAGGWPGICLAALAFTFAESELSRVTENWRLGFGLVLTALALIALRNRPQN